MNKKDKTVEVKLDKEAEGDMINEGSPVIPLVKISFFKYWLARFKSWWGIFKVYF